MRWLLGLMVFLLVSAQTTAGQLTTLPEGLVQAVSRTWLAPVDDGWVLTIEEFNAEGTPIGEPTVIAQSTPVATPEPDKVRGTVVLTAAIFQFESDAAAASAFAEFATFIEETVAQDLGFAATNPIATTLALGAQSYSVMGEARDLPTRSFIAAVVQDGPWLYLLQGTLVGLDADEEVTRLVTPLVEDTVDSDPPTFDPNGASTGGIWAKLTDVQPVLLQDSMVVDAIIVAAADMGG